MAKLCVIDEICGVICGGDGVCLHILTAFCKCFPYVFYCGMELVLYCFSFKGIKKFACGAFLKSYCVLSESLKSVGGGDKLSI